MRNFEIISLRSQPEARRRDLLTRFEREIYRPAFPDDNQREDPAIWLGLLRENPPEPAPYLTILMAVDGAGSIGGGLVLEHYRWSGAALVTYLVVSPRARGQGLARQLIAQALEVLAWSEGRKPIPMLAEMDDPARVPAKKRATAQERAHILGALGLLQCGLPYVQPALSQGGGRLSHMLLCAHEASLKDASLPAGHIAAFLHEFYRSLGVEEPALDADYRAMAQWLAENDPVAFVPLAEGAAREEGA